MTSQFNLYSVQWKWWGEKHLSFFGPTWSALTWISSNPFHFQIEPCPRITPNGAAYCGILSMLPDKSCKLSENYTISILWLSKPLYNTILFDPSVSPDHNLVQIILCTLHPCSHCQLDVYITIMYLSSMTLRVIAITTSLFPLSLCWQMESDNNIPSFRMT